MEYVNCYLNNHLNLFLIIRVLKCEECLVLILINIEFTCFKIKYFSIDKIKLNL